MFQSLQPSRTRACLCEPSRCRWRCRHATAAGPSPGMRRGPAPGELCLPRSAGPRHPKTRHRRRTSRERGRRLQSSYRSLTGTAVFLVSGTAFSVAKSIAVNSFDTTVSKINLSAVQRYHPGVKFFWFNFLERLQSLYAVYICIYTIYRDYTAG